MPAEKPRVFLEILYHEAAQEYLRRLPLEHFMEAVPQAHQRKITLESLDLVHAQLPEIQCFNELLVQYPVKGRKKPKQVVPDNLVVVHPEPIKAEGSFDVPLQPVKPFLVLDYLSSSVKRKDYADNMLRYERELQVPYYLQFQTDLPKMTLYRHNHTDYVSVSPNDAGRYPLPELELEVGLLNGWVRYWFRRELVPEAAELLQQLNEFRRLWQEERRRADQAKDRADGKIRYADGRHSAQDEAWRADNQTRLADREKLEAEVARLRKLLEERSQSSPVGIDRASS